MLASSGPGHKALIVAGCHRTVASYILTFSILRTKYLNGDYHLYTVGITWLKMIEKYDVGCDVYFGIIRTSS